MIEENQKPLFSDESDEVIFAEEEEELSFAEEEEEALEQAKGTWKILIVDDEQEIHNVTKLALNDFRFEGQSLIYLSAFSGKEAKQLIQEHPDTALILLDVVMEKDEAGLEVVKYIREVLDNKLVRIVLRTGQPGQVPEDVVIVHYDINDYKTKTELTTKKLFTTVLTALRAFRTLTTLEASRRELEKIAAASARFVPAQFLHFLQKESIVEAKLGDSVQAEMTILFSDVRSFTTLSESMSPKENFDFINDYLSRVGPVIREHNGFIDKYIGDAIMALFPDTPEEAVRAALAMQNQVSLWNKSRKKNGESLISIGIGLHSGSLMLGTIGEEERMESTVISDAVNLASRLQDLTKLYGAGIAISAKTLTQLEEPAKYSHRFLGQVQVKGKKEPVPVFEIYEADPPALRKLKQQTRADFQRGVALYQKQQFANAEQIFQEILQINPQDKAAALYLKRSCKFQQYGPLQWWDGAECFDEE
ncbi:MAG: response regulator [Oscillatoria princeps RMCB-10]|jgi:two-component system sensor histidine kinase ChiS|nr:response regulator [Oscillatoria princeps RMCB-10]